MLVLHIVNFIKTVIPSEKPENGYKRSNYLFPVDQEKLLNITKTQFNRKPNHFHFSTSFHDEIIFILSFLLNMIT